MFSMVSFAQQSGRAATQKSEAAEASPTIASVLNHSLSSIEKEVMDAAEAIPEDKYDFSPATGNIPGDFKTPEPARSMGAEFKHIGDALEFYSSSVLGQKSPAGGNSPSNVKTKSEVISYLKAEFAKAHSAIDTLNQQNAVEEIPAGRRKTTRLARAIDMIGHTSLTYGNIIEYMRMNGIVPPESRRSS